MSELAAARSDTAAATTARAWLAAMNTHDAAALRALLAEDFAWSDGPASRGSACTARRACGLDRAAVALLTWQDWFAATPDLAFELIRELECGNWSIQQLRLHGTQRAAPSALFTPRPSATPSTRPIDLPGCAVLMTRANHITRLWTYWDEAVLRRPPTLPHPQADF